MKKNGSKYMKIKISTETGEVVKIKDEKGVDATEVSAEELEEVQQNPNTDQIATILHAHSSPGCIYVVIRGWAKKICY
ncbi:MAG: hypothetical protein AMJ54_09710 [Deltaproteobacteria bacterium SG8_13]|nr:MAG: hypothetical protein AMJ54_09710 [Deltaproteobacteria bacterium SG8_13]